MIRHIVSWKFKEGMTQQEKVEAGNMVRSLIKKVKESFDDCISCEVITDLLPTSTAEIMLVATYPTVEALAAYQVCPAHVQASSYMKDLLTQRTCCDFVEENPET